MTIHTLSRQVLQALAKNGPMLKSELNDKGINDTAAIPLSRVLQALSKRKQVLAVRMSANVYEYSITTQGRAALEDGEAVAVDVLQMTPSRTIWNSTSREIYQPGQGRAVSGLAVWSA